MFLSTISLEWAPAAFRLLAYFTIQSRAIRRTSYLCIQFKQAYQGGVSCPTGDGVHPSICQAQSKLTIKSGKAEGL